MKTILRIALFLTILLSQTNLFSQNSVAHLWIDVNLEAVRKDFARPTVHARNLWHTSVVMYDAWAAYDTVATTYFLGKNLGNYNSAFDGVNQPADVQAAREEAISFAAYRMIKHRYTGSPGQVNTFFILDSTMTHLGYDPSFTSIDYTSGSPAALGNFISQQLIIAAMSDGANESDQYQNQYYEPVNDDLVIDAAHFIGNPDIDSLNRWQPLSLTLFCDQGGNPFTTTPEFLSPEWGDVIPFSLADSVRSVKTRDGFEWNVFHDPGAPPRVGLEGDQETELYRWGMELVGKWSSHLDPDNPVMWDISPNSIGNIPLDSFPETFADYPDFYDYENGGDISQGHELNPHTGLPYDLQMVPRGDYARILAEFWADGPDSETPPGHWFDIYNEISEYPEFTWKWNGQDSLDHLEYDIKTYFTLGGGMHDAAISAWSIKGYYDYIRPVSAIRALAELGQSTSDTLPNYHPAGLRLQEGFMELVQLGDTLFESDTVMIAGPEEVGEIKMMCWLGPLNEDTCISGFAPEYQTEVGHVGWKLALDWWPYQRPTFVTPPFAGYVSGHSTYSRAAAEIMTYTTGDRFFPGGMGTFLCPENEYLVFEDGPSMDIELQWATYQDASDQCSLSRIWGGIHPPADDIPGRRIGFEVGNSANTLAERYFNGGYPEVESVSISDQVITDADMASALVIELEYDQKMDTEQTPTLTYAQDYSATLGSGTSVWLSDTILQITYTLFDVDEEVDYGSLTIDEARNAFGTDQVAYSLDSVLYIDTKNPEGLFSLDLGDPAFVVMNLLFDESMDTTSTPMISFPVEDPLLEVMNFDTEFSTWITETQYAAVYSVNPDVQLFDIDVSVSIATDSLGNEMVQVDEADLFSVDNLAPEVVSVTPSLAIVSSSDAGPGSFTIDIVFNEAMDTSIHPDFTYTLDDPLVNTLSPTGDFGGTWSDAFTYQLVYDVFDNNEELDNIDLMISGAMDQFGNQLSDILYPGLYRVDTKEPGLVSFTLSHDLITDALIGPNTVNIVAHFDEPMMTEVQPIFETPNENPGGALALSLPGASWLDENSFQWQFTVIDEDLVLADVDIAFVAASDEGGNQLDTLLIDQIDIEMDNPDVNGLVVSQGMISDADLGNTFELGLKFSEPIDPNSSISIAYPEGDASGTLMTSAQDWPLVDSLVISFDVMDEDLDMEDIDVELSGLVDTVGNAMPIYLAVDLFSIEMLNPQITEVFTTADLIDNSLFGIGTFTIDVEFSEVLDQVFEPSLLFPVEDPSATLSLNSDESTWTSESSYRFTYDVSEGFTVLPDVDIRIESAIDLAGNISYLYVQEDVFDIDIASSINEYGSIEMEVYPNPIPAGSPLILKFMSTKKDKYNVRMNDLLGRTVSLTSVNTADANRIEIETIGMRSGQYILEIQGENNVRSFKIQVLD